MSASDREVHDLVATLGLLPHPEGGFFRETYRHATQVGGRSIGTAIYFLVTAASPSRMHRVTSDEIWHFYRGDALEMLQLAPDGSSRVLRIGPNVAADECPQALVPGGVWQGARVAPPGRYALVGATVAPGFDFADFSMGDRATLERAYPDRAALLAALT